MKVYIITNMAFPFGMASANRIRCYVQALSIVGVECEVLIFRRTERYDEHPQNVLSEGEYEGVKFRYTTGTPLRGRNVFIRKWHDIFDRVGLVRTLRNELKSGDVIYLYNYSDVFFDFILTKLAHIKRCKVAVELCELPYGAIVETHSCKKRRKIVTNCVFPIIDGVIAISDELVNYAVPYVCKDCKIIKIPILVDYAKYDIEDKSSQAQDPFIFHSGSLTEQKDGILGMIEAFGIASETLQKPIKFVFTGNKESSIHSKGIEDLIEKYSLRDKVFFAGYLDERELRDYLQRAALVVINKKTTKQNRYCFSTKLGEYMSAGKPVIITRVGEAMNWLADGQNAIIVEPNNVRVLADAIAAAFSDLDKIRKIGESGRAVARKNFDFRAYSSLLKEFFMELSTQ